MCWASLRFRNFRKTNSSPQMGEMNKSHFLISDLIIQNDSHHFFNCFGKNSDKIVGE